MTAGSTPWQRRGYTTRPRSYRLLVLALFLAVLVWQAWSLVRVAHAERVTIRVERCDASGPKATLRCYGSWTLADGSRHEGVTDGAGDPGTEFRGWATSSAATRDLVNWLLEPLIIAASVLGGPASPRWWCCGCGSVVGAPRATKVLPAEAAGATWRTTRSRRSR